MVTALGPVRFRGDLRWIDFEPEADPAATTAAGVTSNYRALPVRTRLGRFVHAMMFRSDTRAILNKGWDLVHAWEEPYVHGGFQVARWTPAAVPFVFATFQNLAKNYPWPFSWWERCVVRRCNGWIAFGNTVREAMLQRPGYAEKPHVVIPPGVDTARMTRTESMRAEGFRMLGWREQGPLVIGFIGRFVPEKGLGVLMRALGQLPENWRAVFLGGGPELPELTGWASGFGERVRIVSGVPHDHVAPYLNAMDILCAPSLSTNRWREQFGRMIIEAFACAVAVVGSSSGEIPHTIGDAGIVVPEGDHSALANVLRELIQSPDRARALGRQGRWRAEAEFAWPVVAERHLRFFQSLTPANRPAGLRV